MTDQGKYILLWKKYLPAISILLRKTDTETQKLQFYKYEFDKTGARNKTGYCFAVQLNAGKPIGKDAKKAVVVDLLAVLNENDTTSQWLKTRELLVTMTKNYELVIEKAGA